MIRNLKALGLALVAALALSAMTASAASAAPALFTAEGVPAGEKAGAHAGQVGTDTFAIGNLPPLTCATATLGGEAITPGAESTYVKLTPTYETCHIVAPLIGTKTATVTTHGCTYTFNATTNTNSSGGTPTPFSADLTIECPTKPIEIHLNNTNNHNETGAALLCTFDIGNQTINNQIELTNTATHDVLMDIHMNVAVTSTTNHGICGSNANPTSVYKGSDTLTFRLESIGSTVS